MTTSTTNGDIKFFLLPTGTALARPADIEVSGAELLRDPGFETAVLISLCSNARAAEDDPLPDSTDTRSGWWGSEVLDLEIGSRLWLLGRSKLTDETFSRAEEYIKEALQWMIEEGAADEILCTVEKDTTQLNRLKFTVMIVRKDNKNIFFNFYTNWRFQIYGEA